MKKFALSNEVESDYLCPLCGQLIYFKYDTEEEYCSDKNCVLYPVDFKFREFYEFSDAFEKINEKHRELITKLFKFDRKFIAEFIFRKRANWISKFGETNVVEIAEFYTYGQILLDLLSTEIKGSKKSRSNAEELIIEYKELIKLWNKTSDFKEKRFLLSVPGAEPYVMKYLSAFLDMYKSYGIFPGNSIPSELFQFEGVELEATKNIGITSPIDFEQFYKKIFTLSITLRYFFQKDARTSLQYMYDVHPVDIVVLIALKYSLPRGIRYIKENKLREHFNKNNPEDSKRTFEQFIVEYCLNKDKVPIFMKVGSRFVFDRKTIEFFLPYLIGIQSKKVLDSQEKTGRIMIDEQKQIASGIFENEIRKLLRKMDYDVPEDPIKIKYEYDLIGVSTSKNTIRLIEAKYRDFPPSSISGWTLLNQELYPRTENDEALLGQAMKHQKRYEYFVENFNRFKSELRFQGSRRDFEILPIVVTKYLPLIKRYKEVQVMSHEDFLIKLK